MLRLVCLRFVANSNHRMRAVVRDFVDFRSSVVGGAFSFHEVFYTVNEAALSRNAYWQLYFNLYLNEIFQQSVHFSLPPHTHKVTSSIQ